jgi:hypothetical protein
MKNIIAHTARLTDISGNISVFRLRVDTILMIKYGMNNANNKIPRAAKDSYGMPRTENIK